MTEKANEKGKREGKGEGEREREGHRRIEMHTEDRKSGRYTDSRAIEGQTRQTAKEFRHTDIPTGTQVPADICIMRER